MIRFSVIIMGLLCISLTPSIEAAEKVVWTGEVKADGTPTQAIPLDLGKKYFFKVSGYVNLGKFWQNKKALGDDACYEFNAPDGPTKLDTFKNSLNVQCTQPYQPDHIYRSDLFTANTNRVHFWVKDEDYNDNTGALKVEVIEVEQAPKEYGVN